MGLAFANFLADWHYTKGTEGPDYYQLVLAARDYPLLHHYRMGPAQLAIRDNIWETPAAALTVLLAVQHDDPYSRFLERWVVIMRERAG